jgi:TP901-1 family phage major tail protein
MTARSGRNVFISRGATRIAGATADTITFNAGEIDITDKQDAAARTLLADVSVRSVDLSVNGILKDATYVAIMLGTASSILAAYTVTITGLGSAAGNFHMSSFEVTGDKEGAVEFSATLMSSGAIVWTPA